MAPNVLTEDDIYRTSTQYCVWSFTPETLASLRETTNNTEAGHLSGSSARNSSSDASNDDAAERQTPAIRDSLLTPAEELAILNHHTRTLLRTALKLLSLPTPVAATGAVYLKRFYLSHSLLTTPPAPVMPTCLFLATKTEHYYVPLSTFCKKWRGPHGDEVEPEDIIREEGAVTQALRFCFDVRHPFRGLRGVLMEMRSLAEGSSPLVPGSGLDSQMEVQDKMLSLPPRDDEPQTQNQKESKEDDEDGDDTPPRQPSRRTQPQKATVPQAQARAFQAHDRAKEILASAALLSDAYFLYTPAQILFAALLLADEPLALFYLSTKLPTSTSSAEDDESTPSVPQEARDMADKLMATVRACAALLASPAAHAPGKEEVARIEAKLEQCRRLGAEVAEATKMEDTHKGGKRNGDGEDATAMLQSAKKRKLEGAEGERASKSPFGGPLRETNKVSSSTTSGNSSSKEG